MELIQNSGTAATLFENLLHDQAVGLSWLGQAGFALRYSNHRLLIDPYLSDYLAHKYTGKELSHVRIMPPPMEAGHVRDLDLVLCSHRHGDHMDPDSLPILARNNPRCRFMVPRAELDSAANIGLSRSRLIPVNDGDTFHLCDDIQIRVIPSAHETLKQNDKGEHYFLGFVLRMGAFTIYHSGDCVVYEDLARRLRQMQVDLALLPVNGRSQRLATLGILGNMTFDEARDLCLEAGIGALVPHHFGMFDFNTVDPGELQRQIERLDSTVLHCVLPQADKYITLA